ncbi:TPA: hypothetical protein ACGO1T_001757 [Streptococcus suis]
MKWIKLVSRPLTEEEKADGYAYDFMWDCTTPEIDEEVLVSDGEYVWTDTWVECGEGVCFENTECDELYWMPLPDPPTESNYIEVPTKVLREYIEDNYIHQPTADTHVGYNRALGDLRNWLRVLVQGGEP